MKKEDQIEIKSTTHYDQFSTIRGNRPLYPPHLKRLIASVTQKNLLPKNPIIVNASMQVIDGQHRLEVARELGLPIYYIVANQTSLQEVQLLNANHRPWSMRDYLESYITTGKKDYQILLDFANQHRLSISIATQILAGNYGDHSVQVEKFKEGNFKIKDMEEATNMAWLISEVRKHSPDMAWTHRMCVKALHELSLRTDPLKLTQKLSQYQNTITRRVSVKDYLREFENIINSGAQSIKEIVSL